MAGKKTEFSKFNPALAMISPKNEDNAKNGDITAVVVPEKVVSEEEKNISVIKENKNDGVKEENNTEAASSPTTKKKAAQEPLKSFSFKLNNEDYTLMRFICGLNSISMNEYIVKLIRADMKNYEKYISAVKEINPGLFD